MSRILWAQVGAVGLLAAAVTAGCGGSSSSDTAATTTEATATTTTATAERLTSAQWAEYETSRTALRSANTAANATLKKCSDTTQFQDTTALQTCVGDTFSALTVAAGDSLNTLKSFESSVTGSCATALANLSNYVGTFQASAAEMQRAVDSPTMAGYPAASENLQQALTAGKAEAQTFEQECAPA